MSELRQPLPSADRRPWFGGRFQVINLPRFESGQKVRTRYRDRGRLAVSVSSCSIDLTDIHQHGYASYNVGLSDAQLPFLSLMPLHSKPKNARSKRILDAREPQLVENEKTAIFVKGEKTSEPVRIAMKDLVRWPPAIMFSST